MVYYEFVCMQGSAEPEGHTPPGGPSAPGEGQLMGMNPLVGHKVDRYWADVHLLCRPMPLRRNPSLLLCLGVLVAPRG